MADQLNFPPHEGVPGDGSAPTIDGYIEVDPAAPTSELPASSGIDTGWSRAVMYTYQGGTLPQVEIRSLRDNSQPYIYLGFIVRADPNFDDEDVIVVSFQDNYNGMAHAGEERRLHIFPVVLNVGAKTPSTTIPMPYDVRADSVAANIEYYTWNGSAWVHPGTNPTNITAHVRSWKPAGENCWGVELKIPTTNSAEGGGSSWLNLGSPFGVYINVIRVCGSAACAAGPSPAPGIPVDTFAVQEFTFPRADYAASPPTRIIQGALLQEIPPAWYGEGTFGAQGSGAGVKFLNSIAGIGVKQGASSTLSYKIEGQIGTPPVPAENKMTARVVNSGTTPANDVKAEFRIANWGLPPMSYTNWAKIPARNDTSNPNPNTNPTPGGTIPVATNNPPTQADSVDLELWWKLNATERMDYLANSQHQCILVRLTSSQNVNFVEESVRWNFDFQHLSKASEIAQISGRGYPKPENGDEHEFVLHVHHGRVQRGGEQTGALTHVERTGAAFMWMAHGYRVTPGVLEIQARHAHKPLRHFRIMQYVGSFGIMAIAKDPAITEIDYDLAGDTLKQVGDGVYRVGVAHGQDIFVRTRFAAGEKLEPEPFTPPKWTPPREGGDGGGGKPSCLPGATGLLGIFATLGAVLVHWRR
jgi:hypothetical protein